MSWTYLYKDFIIKMREHQINGDDDLLKEKMDMMIAWKLTEHLKLTSEQSEKFFPRLREHRESMNTLTEKERALYKELKDNIERGDALSNSDLNKYLKVKIIPFKRSNKIKDLIVLSIIIMDYY